MHSVETFHISYVTCLVDQMSMGFCFVKQIQKSKRCREMYQARQFNNMCKNVNPLTIQRLSLVLAPLFLNQPSLIPNQPHLLKKKFSVAALIKSLG